MQYSIFCSNHFIGENACRSRCPGLQDAILYVHTYKTGGSALECSTNEQPGMERWINMGHTWNAALEFCQRRCPGSKTAISVRDPYTWWRSTYTYSWYCRYAGKCTTGSFDQWVRNGENFQSQVILKNVPFDYVLRTETLEADFQALLKSEGMPLYKLPVRNPTQTSGRRRRIGDVNSSSSGKMWMSVNKTAGRSPSATTVFDVHSIPRPSRALARGPAPPTVFTRELLDIINTGEARMFDEFGYVKRTEPFELK